MLLLIVIALIVSPQVVLSRSDYLMPNYTMSVLYEGYGWLENLWFCGDTLYFAEWNYGRIWRSTQLGTGKPTIQLQGLDLVLGHACEPSNPEVLYGVGKTKNGDNIVYASKSAGSYEVIAKLDSKHVGNGFGIHNGLLYTASEGALSPTSKVGAVFRIDPMTGNVTTLADNLRSADGLWIDVKRQLLYVGQLYKANLWVWDIKAEKAIGYIPGLRGSIDWLDDFTLHKDGDSILGCDWSQNKIVRFPLVNSSKSGAYGTYLTGMKHPTSIRYGPDGSLYVTEGRILPKTRKSKLLKFTLKE